MNDDRLVEIEIKLAHQEDTVAQLNTIVSAQQRQIERLEALCAWLKEQAGTRPGDAAGDAADEVPPHY